ncbi:unnamed protein product [Rhizophagus irregularis]|nr:unnamed protein product [Rhizophagus irregularis]
MLSPDYKLYIIVIILLWAWLDYNGRAQLISSQLKAEQSRVLSLRAREPSLTDCEPQLGLARYTWLTRRASTARGEHYS